MSNRWRSPPAGRARVGGCHRRGGLLAADTTMDRIARACPAQQTTVDHGRWEANHTPHTYGLFTAVPAAARLGHEAARASGRIFSIPSEVALWRASCCQSRISPTICTGRIKKRQAAKLKQVKTLLMARRHRPIEEQGRWLGSVVRGHLAYYSVPGSIHQVTAFRDRNCRDAGKVGELPRGQP